MRPRAIRRRFCRKSFGSRDQMKRLLKIVRILQHRVMAIALAANVTTATLDAFRRGYD